MHSLQGTFGFPRPGLFRSFEAPVSPAVLDATLADSSDAALGTDSAGADLATVPPPPPPPASPPPPPLAVNSTARWRRSSLPNSTSNSSAPAPAPAPVVANSTAVSFSQLIAWAAIAPAPCKASDKLSLAPSHFIFELQEHAAMGGLSNVRKECKALGKCYDQASFDL